MTKFLNKEIEEIIAPLMGDQYDWSRVALLFAKLNRILTTAEVPAVWQPAGAAMRQFLDRLEQELRCEGWQEGVSQRVVAKVFSVLLTMIAEGGQYRHETLLPPSEGDATRYEQVSKDLLPMMGRLRQKAISIAKTYLALPMFRSLADDIAVEIYPLLDSMDPELAPDRYMPYRVIQVGNIYERLYSFRLRTSDVYLMGSNGDEGLLREIYDCKYLRFGTSGVRGRLGLDFTEVRTKRVAQAICDFLNDDGIAPYAGAEDLSGKRVVIGYDSRFHADLVARWVAEVCVANGFAVDLAYRDTPTPVLVYYLTDYLCEDEVAGLINCTASHNPPEWQGIKFNPRSGYPAPTGVTNAIATRINELQLMGVHAREADIVEAEAEGTVRGFDPIDAYSEWILNSGVGNRRIPVDWERIRRYFADRLVVEDCMYGAGRGYLTGLLGKIGVRHTSIHAGRDPHLSGLDYAKPEEPFIIPLEEKVKASGAALGIGLDTDADRYGVVDKGGVYIRPNQVMPMLINYLGVDRGLTGRVINTMPGSPLTEVLASKIPGNRENEPEPGVLPAYVSHPFYRLIVGDCAEHAPEHTFLVPVGIKYIEEQRRTDRAYHLLKPLPKGWRDTILIGGEESSGLTTRGHVTDKDGIWADMLIMDMLAYYGTREKNPLTSLREIWEEMTSLDGLWVSYGDRRDTDAVLEAKEELIGYYFDSYAGDSPAEKTIAGLEVVYAGGIRYDLVEMRLRDADGDDRHYLRVRASGTEPIIRIYVESSDADVMERLAGAALAKLEELSAAEVTKAQSEWRLAEVLSATQVSDRVRAAVEEALAAREGWTRESLIGHLRRQYAILERRNQKTAAAWIEALSEG